LSGTAGDPAVDWLGVRHAPAGPDARIVSLVPSITELLIDLGLARQLVGRTHYCVHPAEAVRKIPSLGGTKKISIPKLRLLHATHAILNVDENTQEMAEAVQAVVPHVVVTHPLGPDDNPPLFRLMGALFGREREAAALVAAYDAARARLAELARTLPPRDVLYLIWREPWMAVSRDTYIARLLALVNWTTLGHDPAARYPEIALTDDLLAATDLVLFSTEPYAFAEADVAAFQAAHPDGPPAALIDGEYASWYGSRAIAAMDYLARFAAGFAGKPSRARRQGRP
jgi:ABC-type Fe3+-hydroxamate transport system substrate-binding protein